MDYVGFRILRKITKNVAIQIVSADFFVSSKEILNAPKGMSRIKSKNVLVFTQK